MLKVTTKEELLYFMQCGMMRLSINDLRFVHNMHMISCIRDKALTSNQVELFGILTKKYKKQLDKHKISQAMIENMPWSTKIVESDPEFTNAHITIVDNHIYFRAPFNKSFLIGLRKDNLVNTFIWNKELKRYESKFSTHALKLITSIAQDHYKFITHCEVTKKLLNIVNHYDALYWEPTLIPFNEQYIIAASNSFLDEAIKDIELSTNIKSISRLAEHGIKIDSSIINDGKLKFASEFEPIIDFVNFDLVAQWLKELECDTVYYSSNARKNFMYVTENVDRILSNLKIKLKVYSNNLEIPKSKYNVLLVLTTNAPTIYNCQFNKIIKMKNSTPISIK